MTAPQDFSKTVDVNSAVAYAIPLRTKFRGITVREGVLFSGPAGWGDFCPFPEYDDVEAARWLACAVEQASRGWPDPVREQVAVNCIVPAVDSATAFEMVRDSGCGTAKVKVAEHPDSASEDIARVEAVRAALGSEGKIRVDANGKWDVTRAVSRIRELERAAGGLDYVEQPCATVAELAAVRRRVDVRIAADESIRRAADPRRVMMAEAADIAILKCAPLGGVREALRVAEQVGLPCVVSSALETSVGLAAQVALAGALPELHGACGLGTMALFAGDVVPERLVPRNGGLAVPRRAPVPDPDLVRRYRQRDVLRAQWWTNRFVRVFELLTGVAGPSNTV